MEQSEVVVIFCGRRLLNTRRDLDRTIPWEDAIDALLQNGFCEELSDGRFYEITDAGYRRVEQLEEVDRQEFAASQEVFIAATLELSWEDSTTTVQDYVVRMFPSNLRRQGIEWNYDSMLRDPNFKNKLD